MEYSIIRVFYKGVTYLTICLLFYETISTTLVRSKD